MLNPNIVLYFSSHLHTVELPQDGVLYTVQTLYLGLGTWHRLLEQCRYPNILHASWQDVELFEALQITYMEKTLDQRLMCHVQNVYEYKWILARFSSNI